MDTASSVSLFSASKVGADGIGALAKALDQVTGIEALLEQDKLSDQSNG
ncbi:hypothetical protein [Massilia yuzhufengensis]|nr:hypothetical protein [Massilia yuzhufengensis]